jgi:TRAP-type mannitol/chloroaromatic compound transport system permease small subunit
MLRVLGSVLRIIDTINAKIGEYFCWVVYALTGLVCFEVFRRYVFNNPSTWSFEVTLWLFGVPAVLGGGYLLLDKGHVNTDIVYKRFSTRGKAILDVITSIFFFIFIGALILHGWKMLVNAIVLKETTWTEWHPIIWPIKSSIFIGAILIFLQGIALFIRNVYTAITGKEPII